MAEETKATNRKGRRSSGARPSNGAGDSTTAVASADDATDPLRAMRFVLNPHLRVIRCSKDEIVVKHGSRSLYSQTIADEERTGMLGKLIGHAAKATSLQELSDSGAFSPDEELLARQTVEYLASQEVLVDPQQDFAQTYLNSILGREMSAGGAPARPPLSQATVAILGCGPLGSVVARGLAASGLGSLILIDERGMTDTPGSARTLDLPPSENGDGANALCERVGSHVRHSGTAVDTRFANPADAETITSAFETADLLVVAWEAFSPTLFHAVNEAAIAARKPWMTVFFDGSEAIVGPTYLPGSSPCYYEFEIQNEATLLLRDEFVLYKDDAEDEALRRVHFTLPAHAQIAAGFATTSVLRMLTLGHTFTVGRAIRLDLERMSVDYVDVLRLPRCPACREERPAYRHLFL
jgi:bacteriocin biosynthesis cyclodehydratase domain-containing protein